MNKFVLIVKCISGIAVAVGMPICLFYKSTPDSVLLIVWVISAMYVVINVLETDRAREAIANTKRSFKRSRYSTSIIREELRSIQEGMKNLTDKLEGDPDSQKSTITNILSNLRLRYQPIGEGLVRANIITLVGRRLAVLYHSGMDGYDDRNIHLDLGKGCSGRSYQQICQIVGKREGSHSTPFHDVSDDQMKKVSEDLRWIVSTPIIQPRDTRPCAVLNIDGLAHNIDEDNLKKLLTDTRFVSTLFGELFSDSDLL